MFQNLEKIKMGWHLINGDWFKSDWFINLSYEMKLYWIFINLNCDCAGVFEPALKFFEFSTGVKVDFEKFMVKINLDYNKVLTLINGKYFLTEYIRDHTGANFEEPNTVQKGILKVLEKNQIDLKYVMGSNGYKEP